MPFEYRLPILTLFFVKFVLPFGFRFLAIFAIVIAFVATGALAALNVVI